MLEASCTVQHPTRWAAQRKERSKVKIVWACVQVHRSRRRLEENECGREPHWSHAYGEQGGRQFVWQETPGAQRAHIKGIHWPAMRLPSFRKARACEGEIDECVKGARRTACCCSFVPAASPRSTVVRTLSHTVIRTTRSDAHGLNGSDITVRRAMKSRTGKGCD